MNWPTAAVAVAFMVMIMVLAVAGCASGPNEKPVWKAYRLEVRP